MTPENRTRHVEKLIDEIKAIVATSRQNLGREINQQLIRSYWQIGKTIVEREEAENLSARQLVLDLSRELTKQLGRGFSRSNLFNMRIFYKRYPDVQTLSGHLSWSHLCELLSIEDKDKRTFYEKETENAKWSVRNLKGKSPVLYLKGYCYQKEQLIKTKY